MDLYDRMATMRKVLISIKPGKSVILAFPAINNWNVVYKLLQEESCYFSTCCIASRAPWVGRPGPARPKWRSSSKSLTSSLKTFLTVNSAFTFLTLCICTFERDTLPESLLSLAALVLLSTVIWYSSGWGGSSGYVLSSCDKSCGRWEIVVFTVRLLTPQGGSADFCFTASLCKLAGFDHGWALSLGRRKVKLRGSE